MKLITAYNGDSKKAYTAISKMGAAFETGKKFFDIEFQFVIPSRDTPSGVQGDQVKAQAGILLATCQKQIADARQAVDDYWSWTSEGVLSTAFPKLERKKEGKQLTLRTTKSHTVMSPKVGTVIIDADGYSWEKVMLTPNPHPAWKSYIPRFSSGYKQEGQTLYYRYGDLTPGMEGFKYELQGQERNPRPGEHPSFFYRDLNHAPVDDDSPNIVRVWFLPK